MPWFSHTKTIASPAGHRQQEPPRHQWKDFMSRKHTYHNYKRWTKYAFLNWGNTVVLAYILPVHEIFPDLAPPPLSGIIKQYQNTSTELLQNTIQKIQSAFSYWAAHFWNTGPTELRTITNKLFHHVHRSMAVGHRHIFIFQSIIWRMLLSY